MLSKGVGKASVLWMGVTIGLLGSKARQDAVDIGE